MAEIEVAKPPPTIAANCARCLLGLFGGLLAISSLFYIIVSIIFLSKYADFGSGGKISVHVFNLLLHLYIIAYSIVGVVGLCCRIESLTKFFVYACFINLFIWLVWLMILLVPVATESLQESFHEIFQKHINNYATDESARKALNTAQSFYRCCGKDGPGDYRSRNIPLPDSCKIETLEFVEGCAERAIKYEVFSRIWQSFEWSSWLGAAIHIFIGYQMGRSEAMAGDQWAPIGGGQQSQNILVAAA